MTFQGFIRLYSIQTLFKGLIPLGPKLRLRPYRRGRKFALSRIYSAVRTVDALLVQLWNPLDSRRTKCETAYQCNRSFYSRQVSRLDLLVWEFRNELLFSMLITLRLIQEQICQCAWNLVCGQLKGFSEGFWGRLVEIFGVVLVGGQLRSSERSWWAVN